ncbi:hypothetical protein Hanom_Chr15g01370831 [Helianthus anomalus]
MTLRPARVPASFVACRCLSLKYAGTVITTSLTIVPRYASAVSFKFFRIMEDISSGAVAKLDPNDRGVENVYTKNFYRTGGSKTYIPKNFYTKTTYITLLLEKFGGSGAPPRPFYPSPMFRCKFFVYTLVFKYNHWLVAKSFDYLKRPCLYVFLQFRIAESAPHHSLNI